jgi:hypothetical protein
MVKALKDADDPLAGDYAKASEMAALASRMANLKGGAYPLLGKGDVNPLFAVRRTRAAIGA